MSYDDILWGAVKETLFCTREEYLATLKDWFVWALEQDGETLALRVSNGPEFHFVIVKRKSFTMADIRAMVKPLIDSYGYATTRTPLRDKRQQRFNERLGFVRVREDQYDVIYRIDKLP